MSKFKKSPALYVKLLGEQIIKQDGVIKSIVVLQEGKDKVGDNFDEVSLSQLVVLGNSQDMGVKSRFGHPNMCDSALGTYIGRYKNYSVSKNKDGKKVVIADLYLDPVSKNAPKWGNLYDYVLDMAEKNDDMFGNSIVYRPGEQEIKIEKDKDDKDVEVAYERFESFIASDLVDSPAATTSLFKDTEDFASRATQFLDENQDVFEVLVKNEQVVNQFLTKYKSYKQNKMKKSKFKEWLLGVKKEISTIFADEKEFTATTAAGTTITISDDDGDGVAKQGDTVTDGDGKPVASSSIEMEDGSKINTDEAGKITSIDPKAEAATAEDTKTEKEQAEEWKKKYEAEVEGRKEDNDAAEKVITDMKERLKKYRSTYEPDKSQTQFRGKQAEGEETPDERKQKILDRQKEVADKKKEASQNK